VRAAGVRRAWLNRQDAPGRPGPPSSILLLLLLLLVMVMVMVVMMMMAVAGP
jgi:hypothetical protein